MILVFRLRDKITGFEADYTEEYASYVTEDTIEYVWDHGNYSCDCNRSLFLYGENPPREFPCRDAQIELVSVTDSDGLQVYTDGEWTW